jgi:hypothetical protein
MKILIGVLYQMFSTCRRHHLMLVIRSCNKINEQVTNKTKSMVFHHSCIFLQHIYVQLRFYFFELYWFHKRIFSKFKE